MADRFYCGCIVDDNGGRAQVDDTLQRIRSVRLNERLLRLAQEEYDRQHPGQPYDRMQERGGLSILELLALLGDHVTRLKAQLKARE